MHIHKTSLSKLIIFINIISITYGYTIKRFKCLKNSVQCNISWESLVAEYYDENNNKHLCHINSLIGGDNETYRQEEIISKNYIDMISTLQCDNFNKTLKINGYSLNVLFLTEEISLKNAAVEILPFKNMGIPKIKLNKDCPFLVEAFYTDNNGFGRAQISWSLNMRIE